MASRNRNAAETQLRDQEQVEGEGRARGRGGLKQFVEEMKGKQHKAIEMRIAVLCAFGVAARLIFSNELSTQTLQSALMFVGGELVSLASQPHLSQANITAEIRKWGWLSRLKVSGTIQ